MGELWEGGPQAWALAWLGWSAVPEPCLSDRRRENREPCPVWQNPCPAALSSLSWDSSRGTSLTPQRPVPAEPVLGGGCVFPSSEGSKQRSRLSEPTVRNHHCYLSRGAAASHSFSTHTHTHTHTRDTHVLSMFLYTRVQKAVTVLMHSHICTHVCSWATCIPTVHTHTCARICPHACMWTAACSLRDHGSTAAGSSSQGRCVCARDEGQGEGRAVGTEAGRGLQEPAPGDQELVVSLRRSGREVLAECHSSSGATALQGLPLGGYPSHMHAPGHTRICLRLAPHTRGTLSSQTS